LEWPESEVETIWHPAVGQQPHAGALGREAEQFAEGGEIIVLVKDVAVYVPSIEDAVTQPGLRSACGAWDGCNYPAVGSGLQPKA
jgi:hypothetical protein